MEPRGGKPEPVPIGRSSGSLNPKPSSEEDEKPETLPVFVDPLRCLPPGSAARPLPKGASRAAENASLVGETAKLPEVRLIDVDGVLLLAPDVKGAPPRGKAVGGSSRDRYDSCGKAEVLPADLEPFRDLPPNRENALRFEELDMLVTGGRSDESYPVEKADALPWPREGELQSLKAEDSVLLDIDNGDKSRLLAA